MPSQLLSLKIRNRPSATSRDDSMRSAPEQLLTISWLQSFPPTCLGSRVTSRLCFSRNVSLVLVP